MPVRNPIWKVLNFCLCTHRGQKYRLPNIIIYKYNKYEQKWNLVCVYIWTFVFGNCDNCEYAISSSGAVGDAWGGGSAVQIV